MSVVGKMCSEAQERAVFFKGDYSGRMCQIWDETGAGSDSVSCGSAVWHLGSDRSLLTLCHAPVSEEGRKAVFQKPAHHIAGSFGQPRMAG